MPGPLSGRRFIDFTWAWAGPYGALQLALLGAEVIKVESTTRMDHSRLRSLAAGQFKGGHNQAPMFNELNLNKRSITLNLKTPEAQQIVKQLAERSDGAIDNFRPGTLDKLGLGYDHLNAVRPEFVMVSSSAVGAAGPERNYVGYAPTFAALAASLTSPATPTVRRPRWAAPSTSAPAPPPPSQWSLLSCTAIARAKASSSTPPLGKRSPCTWASSSSPSP